MRILILSFLLFTVVVAFSQESKLLIGIEGGAGISRCCDSYDMSSGYSSTVTTEYYLTKLLSIKSGIGYELLKGQDDITFTDENGDFISFGNVEQNNNYLTIPLSARATFGNKIKFTTGVGTFFSFLMSAKFKTGIVGDITNTDNFKTFNSGISISVGTIIPLSERLGISIDLINNNGLVNFATTEGSEAKSFSALAVVGVKYRL